MVRRSLVLGRSAKAVLLKQYRTGSVALGKRTEERLLCRCLGKGTLTIFKWPKKQSKWPKHLVVLNFVNSVASETIMVVGPSPSSTGFKVFRIEENREEEAEKTPSTCSTNQGNQHFSHLVYCDTRINKI